VLCAMTERPILLIAGAEGVGKTAVAATFLGLEQRPVGTSFESDLTFKTKYYTADVELVVFNGKPSNFAETAVGRCEALVLLFSFRDASSVDAVKEWEGFIQEAAPEVIVVMGSEADALDEPRREAVQSSIQEWCLDHSAELVVCPSKVTASPGLDSQTPRRGLLDEAEAHGVARVVEAIQCTMWSNLVPLQAAPAAATGVADQTESEATAVVTAEPAKAKPPQGLVADEDLTFKVDADDDEPEFKGDALVTQPVVPFLSVSLRCVTVGRLALWSRCGRHETWRRLSPTNRDGLWLQLSQCRRCNSSMTGKGAMTRASAATMSEITHTLDQECCSRWH